MKVELATAKTLIYPRTYFLVLNDTYYIQTDVQTHNKVLGFIKKNRLLRDEKGRFTKRK